MIVIEMHVPSAVGHFLMHVVFWYLQLVNMLCTLVLTACDELLGRILFQWGCGLADSKYRQANGSRFRGYDDARRTAVSLTFSNTIQHLPMC